MDRIKQLKPGTLIELELKTPQTHKFKCPLIGVENHRFVLLSFPSEDQYPRAGVYIQSDTPVVARFVLEDEIAEIIAFKSTIISTLCFPSKLFFIRFPQKLQIHNLRKENRVKTNLAATLILRTKDHPQANVIGNITDLSNNGCCFTFDVDRENIYTYRQQVELLIHLPGGKNIKLLGRVRNHRYQEHPCDQGLLLRLGIELEAEQANTRIISFLGLSSQYLRANTRQCH